MDEFEAIDFVPRSKLLADEAEKAALEGIDAEEIDINE